MKKKTSVPSRHADQQDGFALVAVLGFFLLLSFVLLTFSQSARIRAATAANEFQTFQYSLMSEALLQVTVDRLIETGRTTSTEISAKWQLCKMEDYSFFTHITNHAGLIDLNAAGIGLLSVGFQSLRLPAPQADTLARAVDYYRRMDRQPLDSELATLIGSSGYKRSAFEDVVELRDFTDLKVYSPEVLSNVFTVHSRRGTIATDLAPPELRAALSQASNNNQIVQSQNAIGDALTGEMVIYRHQKLQFATSVVFALTADDARMLYSPTISYAPDDNERNFDDVSNCAETFGGETVRLLREVLE